MATKGMWQGVKVGDAIEIAWQDAVTIASWLDMETAVKVELARVTSRGTLLALHDDRVIMAMDVGADGGLHGVGVVARCCVKSVVRLEHPKVRRKAKS